MLDLGYSQYLALDEDDRRVFREAFAGSFNDLADAELEKGAKQVVLNSQGEVVHVAKQDSDSWDSPKIEEVSKETDLPHFGFHGISRIGMGSVRVIDL